MINGDLIKVSVVMPIYNAYDYLRPALDSVLGQTLEDIELICVDDGSIDRSLDVIKEYQKSDSRIRILTESNAGPSIARNKGLARARGEFVIFLDADDFYEPELLEKLYNLAVADNLDIAVAKYDIYNSRKARFEPKISSEHDEIFDRDGIVSRSKYPDYIFQCTTTYVWNKLFKRSFLTSKGLLFPEEIRVFEDVYFVLCALAMADRVGKVSEVLVHHRVYSQQSKNKLFKKYYNQVPSLYAELKKYLMQNGVFSPLFRTFINYTTSRCFKIYNVLWNDAKDEFWNLLYNGAAEKIDWIKADPDDFESEEVRDFTASVLIYNHKQYLKREKKGARVKISGVRQGIKNVRFRKRIRELLSKLFGKKKDK